MSDASLRDLERQWKKTGEEADANAYLAERLRTEPQLTLRLIKRMLRIELTVAALARWQERRIANDPTVDQILEWLDTGSIAEAPSVPVQATPAPLSGPGSSGLTTISSHYAAGQAPAAPSHPWLYDDMNRGYSEEWLRVECGSPTCRHERGIHGPPLDSRIRGACLYPRCRCAQFHEPAQPETPAPRTTPRNRRRSQPGATTT